MSKELLIFMSHNFCVNCCGNAKKFDCDCRNVTCDKLANFLLGCSLYKEEINEEELDKIATLSYRNTFIGEASDAEIYRIGYRNGYKKAREE